VFTLLGDKLKDFVDDKMKKREKKIVLKQSMEVNIIPEIKEIFQKSHAVSRK
jgi:hypothetical protein